MNLQRVLRRMLLAAALGMTGCAAPDADERAATHASTTTQTGALDGAAYRFDIPANWNHQLIVYYHGYSVDPIVFRDGEPLSPMFAPLVAKGYALIQSGYSQTGCVAAVDFLGLEGGQRVAVALERRREQSEEKRDMLLGLGQLA